ncbi:hypothetical protein LMH73_025770 [Vibrio splendidus]|nr:hypothetical protein [Vibrio splendidus]MCC4880864.1 hypothetical protein [Vibrio splendidus]
MKKLLIPLLMLPTLAFAHGHTPQKFDKYVMDSVFELNFSVTNGFAKKTCYDIEINGEIDSTLRKCIPSKGVRKLSVWLQSKPDVQTQNIVCSIADIPGMRTRMCTDAITLFPAKRLGLE